MRALAVLLALGLFWSGATIFAAEFAHKVLSSITSEQIVPDVFSPPSVAREISLPFTFSILEDQSLWVQAILPDELARVSLGPFVIDRARARHVELGAYLPHKLFLFSGRIFLVASRFLSPSDRLYLLELLPHLGPPPTGLQKMRARFEATLSGVFDAQKFVGHVEQVTGVNLPQPTALTDPESGKPFRLLTLGVNPWEQVIDAILQTDDETRFLRLSDVVTSKSNVFGCKTVLSAEAKNRN